MRWIALEPIVRFCLQIHSSQRAFSLYSLPEGIGLAAHLEVPLPYLLYRVNARFQEEIRGLKDIQGALSPTSPQLPFPITGESKPPPSFTTKVIPNENRMSTSRQANGTPLGIRARLNSLSNNFAHRHKKVSTSSSTMTLQDTKRPLVLPHMRPTSPSSSSSDDTDSSDEEASKEEEAERIAEEEEALSRKLAELQNMMTNESIGLVSGTTRQKAAKTRDRGRTAPTSPLSKVAYLQDSHSHYSASASRSASQSVSSASSPRGSIHDIPGERNVNVAGQNLSMPRNPGSSPARAARNTQSHQTHRRHGPLVDRMGDLSSHGSEASSFSDLSGKTVFHYQKISCLMFLNKTPASPRQL